MEQVKFISEKIEKGQEKDGSIDFFDVEDFEKRIAFYRQEIGKSSTEEDMKESIQREYNLFLRFEQLQTTYLWRTLIHSDDPYIKAIREKNQKRSDRWITMTMVDLSCELEKGTFPVDSWIACLHEYKNMLENYNEQLQQAKPQIIKEIVKGFDRNINPLLDEAKNTEDLKRTLEAIHFKIKDPLTSGRSIGNHNSAYATISLDLHELIKEEGEHLSPDAMRLIAHEAMHAWSTGQTLKHTKVFQDEDGGTTFENSITHNQWTGLEVSGAAVTRFKWLNEAMTELLASGLTETEAESYSQERRLLKLLLTKGAKNIPIKTLINAYFEQRGYAAQDNEKKHHYWKIFIQEIRQAYSHDKEFLVKLDILVQDGGIKAAIELLEHWDPKHPVPINVKEIEKEKEEKVEKRRKEIMTELGMKEDEE